MAEEELELIDVLDEFEIVELEVMAEELAMELLSTESVDDVDIELSSEDEEASTLLAGFASKVIGWPPQADSVNINTLKATVAKGSLVRPIVCMTRKI